MRMQPLCDTVYWVKLKGGLMTGQAAPFHSFSFTLIANRRPRTALRLTQTEGELYELHVEKGSASNPSSQFTRMVPLESAVRLRDVLQDIGAFGWDESYGDTKAPGSLRWNMSTVFKKDVFSVASKGGSDTPAGFDALLEELYRLDFPRPDDGRGKAGAQGSAGAAGGGMPGMGSMLNSLGMGSVGRMSVGDLGAYSATGGLPGMGDGAGVDLSQMADALQGNGLGGFDAAEMRELMAQAQSNPQAIQQRMREEFKHLSPAEQDQMLDTLASTGLATREWWKRFLS